MNNPSSEGAEGAAASPGPFDEIDTALAALGVDVAHFDEQPSGDVGRIDGSGTGAAERPRRHARFGPSLPRNFRLLWGATALSNVGDGLRLVALPLLATSVTDDPRLIAGVTVAERLPWLFFILPGGAWADRYDRRAVAHASWTWRGRS